MAQSLIRRARRLYQDEPLAGDLEETVYALDSTTIDLCLGLFPWAHFRPTKSAIKLHTVLDLRGSIPTAITITEGKRGDVRLLDELLLETGSFYIIDRGYVDFRRLHRFVQASAFFITRGKRRLKFTVLTSSMVDAATGLRCDQLIRLGYWKSRDDYPGPLRRISYTDPATRKHLVFLTNNLTQPPLVIAALYRSRWQVELFFKWIKQRLRIKHFYGNSANAVRTQIWIAGAGRVARGGVASRCGNTVAKGRRVAGWIDQNQRPGLVVLVAQDGKILFEKGYGLADLEHDVPIIPQSTFRIGLITKQFTASAILKLQEQGKLIVNYKLSKYLPDFPRGDLVTLGQLLNHTGGIHS